MKVLAVFDEKNYTDDMPEFERYCVRGVIVRDGKIAGLQRGKDSVKEVKKGFECGITLESYSDLKEGDTLEAYEIVEVKK